MVRELIIFEFQKNLEEITKGLIPIGIISWNGGWEKDVIFLEQDADDQYPDDFKRIDDWLTFKEAVAVLKNDGGENPEDVIFCAIIAEAVRRTADKFSKAGLRHESVTWLCHNLDQKDVNINSFGKFGWVPNGKTIRYLSKNYREYLTSLTESEDIVHLQLIWERASHIFEIRFNKAVGEVKALMHELSMLDNIYHVTDMSNHLGEEVGWTEYNLETMTVSGYKVTCWSSSLLGLGNCNCINHDPGYDFSEHITLEHLKCLKKELELCSSEKNSFAKLAEEYSELVDNDLIITTTKTQYGNQITAQSVKFTSEGGCEWGINCHSSSDFDLGTCQCQSHNSTYAKKLSASECREFINKYLGK